MLELFAWGVALFVVFGIPYLIEKNGSSNHKNMSNSQIDNEIDKYLK